MILFMTELAEGNLSLLHSLWSSDAILSRKKGNIGSSDVFRGQAICTWTRVFFK